MKLPRWLVMSMLAASELAILVFAGCWWVTWPERTFRKYHSLIRAGQIEAANSIFDGSDHSLKVAKPIYADTYLYLKPASLLDLITARLQKPIPGLPCSVHLSFKTRHTWTRRNVGFCLPCGMNDCRDQPMKIP